MNIRIVYSAFYMILDSLNNSSLFTQTTDGFAMFICMYAFLEALTQFYGIKD